MHIFHTKANEQSRTTVAEGLMTIVDGGAAPSGSRLAAAQGLRRLLQVEKRWGTCLIDMQIK